MTQQKTSDTNLTFASVFFSLQNLLAFAEFLEKNKRKSIKLSKKLLENCKKNKENYWNWVENW